jgi:hypothetical protein
MKNNCINAGKSGKSVFVEKRHVKEARGKENIHIKTRGGACLFGQLICATGLLTFHQAKNVSLVA